MTKSECVWFKNKSTGYVDGVDRGGVTHRRMAAETYTDPNDPDGIPRLVWEEVSAPTVSKTTKYEPGMQADVQVPLAEREFLPEDPPEARGLDPADFRRHGPQDRLDDHPGAKVNTSGKTKRPGANVEDPATPPTV